MEHVTQQRGGFAISTDPARLNLDAILDALSRLYWAQGRAPETTARALKHSLCFGVYHGQAQIGLARVVTDFATFAYLADVYILEAYRGQGLGTWLIEVVTAHPALQGLRRWHLVTRDAHSLYARFGFEPLHSAERHMERVDPSL